MGKPRTEQAAAPEPEARKARKIFNPDIPALIWKCAMVVFDEACSFLPLHGLYKLQMVSKDFRNSVAPLIDESITDFVYTPAHFMGEVQQSKRRDGSARSRSEKAP